MSRFCFMVQVMFTLLFFLPAISAALESPAPQGGKVVDTAPFETNGAVAMRDPFNRYIPSASGKGVRVVPLLRYPLMQFRLVALMGRDGEASAMLLGPDGKNYIVRQGDLVGVNKGVVRTIDKEGIMVEERYRDKKGRSRVRRRRLTLPATH